MVRNLHFTRCVALYIQVFVSSKFFFVYVVIIEVNHLLTKSTMLASEPTSFLSLMIFVLSSLNDF